MGTQRIDESRKSHDGGGNLPGVLLAQRGDGDSLRGRVGRVTVQQRQVGCEASLVQVLEYRGDEALGATDGERRRDEEHPPPVVARHGAGKA